MNTLTGCMYIAGAAITGAGAAFRARNPATGEEIGAEYREADAAQIAQATSAAAVAFTEYAYFPASRRAAFLRAIADGILALGDALIDQAQAESALPRARLETERLRTMHQLRLMAETIEEGSWVEARIDTGDPSRAPTPKPDLRRMLVPLGPVAVFGASNFPFAYSIVGGDTASALAAGCPVVSKAHPAQPGTSEMLAAAVTDAARRLDMPAGVFSAVQGWSHETGTALVTDARIQAVGFTGSLRGGRAIFDAAAKRPEPIPVYAEMGSVNPVFLLPSAVAERGAEIANGLANSMTQGVGQFCTNPGILVGVRSEALDALVSALAHRIRDTAAGVMLYDGLHQNFERGVERSKTAGAHVVAEGGAAQGPSEAHVSLLGVDARTFVDTPALREEMFGPASILVTANSVDELEQVAEAMEGQLTASIHGTEEELVTHARLVRLLERRVGRLIYNGYPTGVEVGHAMQHGGPYPASSDARTTAVGSASIVRFARPVCYQNFPARALPSELRDANDGRIWRMIDGRLTQDDVS